MPATTYVEDAVIERWVETLDHADIGELLREINIKTNQRWVVRQMTITGERRWFQKALITKRYCLYVHLWSTEWQIVNFPGPGINHWVDEFVVHTYLLGFVSGFITGKESQ